MAFLHDSLSLVDQELDRYLSAPSLQSSTAALPAARNGPGTKPTNGARRECVVNPFAGVVPRLDDRHRGPTAARLWRWLFEELPNIGHQAGASAAVESPHAVKASGCVAFAAAREWAEMAREWVPLATWEEGLVCEED
ncbi:hypothetical protein DFJ73DRAFT_777832 [Zopfochytrium polystomum]|nr:hypothetical protein DFJ73DRAFT_777832 [Zopfochytrium polystomum]